MPKNTSLSISRSSLTARSRPCCDTLFLLFNWNSPPITSALYPYVHTLALGISGTKYCSGQKTSGEAGGRGAPLLVSVALALCSLKNDLRSLRLRPAVSMSVSVTMLGSASVSALVSAGPVQVFRGCPRRPWTNITLSGVRVSRFKRRGSGVLLQSGPVVASALATGEPCKAVAVDLDHLLFTL
jgi:hypothetical protein